MGFFFIPSNIYLITSHELMWHCKSYPCIPYDLSSVPSPCPLCHTRSLRALPPRYLFCHKVTSPLPEFHKVTSLLPEFQLLAHYGANRPNCLTYLWPVSPKTHQIPFQYFPLTPNTRIISPQNFAHACMCKILWWLDIYIHKNFHIFQGFFRVANILWNGLAESKAMR